ncbi:uncharacterized protein LOC101734404 [Xenopus tropicalis]|uniref:Uncharacterized protein LOC101734404 n=1 Tax=Xenopus tropicalis TaxID=8364 RepID=A0A8J1IUH5_XENTR|nr:uncharacterized protein LOC101734404 [Xenopus tropicalis]
MASNGQLVGIFSREAREAYDWLISSLLTKSAVRDVRTVHISNTNYRDVIYEADKCTFAILYHTKNRGRINITDVTDALYDRELEDLSRCLGRDRVIVVIDDLEDSSLEAKHIILQNQPSIGRWAVELFLFSDQEKTYQRRPLEDNKMAQMETLIKNKISRQDYSVYMGNDNPAEGRNSSQRLYDPTSRPGIWDSFKVNIYITYTRLTLNIVKENLSPVIIIQREPGDRRFQRPERNPPA